MIRAARFALVAFLAVLLLGAPTDAGAAPPNVLVVMTDDQGWGDLSLNGNANLATPNADRLAREGAVFDRFYACPLCAPTRAEFLTGRYHPRGGVRGVTRGEERLDLDERTIAEAMREAGYATGLFGKWHNGSQYPYHPLSRGFDTYYGFASGHWGDYFDEPLESDGEIARGRGYLPDDIADRAIEFADANADAGRPFFAFVAICTPHSPYQVPDEFWERFRDREIAMRHRDPEKEDVGTTRAVLAMCENIDWNLGRILARLDERGLARDTIVVFLSDNGPNSWRSNGGMKGRKGSTDEGGVRVPCIVRWPARVPAGLRIDRIAGAIDLFPTLAEMTGATLPDDRELDGQSMAPLLFGEGPRIRLADRTIFSHQAGTISARTQRWRLDGIGRLFDMEADPGQDRDVAAEHPDVAARLAESVAKWKAEVASQAAGPDERPFTVGGDAGIGKGGIRRATFLPARDGVATGGIERSGRAPNCSYYTNWRSPDDAIAWPVEVLEAGEYEVAVYATCPEDAVGTRLELKFGEAAAEGEATEAWDPPAHGQENDRAPRGTESFVKDFKPIAMGRIRLPAGRGELVLRATRVEGSRGLDFRALSLRSLR